MKHTMLHMELNSAVSVFAVAAAFSVLLPPSSALAGICFLPDCQDSDTMHGDININVNQDTEWCEKKGYTYYSSGKCPQYQAQVGKCKKDDYYLKCDPVKWCTDNGYNTQSCSLPSFVNEQCPNGKPYYKQCKEDRPRACRESGYVDSCSPARLYATTNRCQWDSSYGKCCTAAPSAGCPSNYGVSCTGGANGKDTCGYSCYRCCDDTCPGRSEKYYSGSKAGKTECGTQCYYCKDCTSGSTSYSGDHAGTSECGTCYYCSDTCSSGTKGGVSCSGNYVSTRISSTECGSGCYECRYNSDCDVTSKSCSYGCASYNSCSKCTSCKSKPAEPPCSDYKSCTSELISDPDDGHCQTGYAPDYRGICALKIRRTRVTCDGKEEIEEGFAYDIIEHYSTEAECNEKAPQIKCYDTGYRWPYNC